MQSSSPERPPLNDHQMHLLSQRPEFRQRLRVMDIITTAFFLAPVLYFAILAGGFLHPATEGAGRSIWHIVLVFVLGQIPFQVYMAHNMLDDIGPSPTDFNHTAGRGQTLLVVALSFAESDTIYGLITPFLRGPDIVAYGLMAFGMIHLIATVAVLRPRIIRLSLTALAAEGEGRTTPPAPW